MPCFQMQLRKVTEKPMFSDLHRSRCGFGSGPGTMLYHHIESKDFLISFFLIFLSVLFLIYWYLKFT
jgi:hypothetical protein